MKERRVWRRRTTMRSDEPVWNADFFGEVIRRAREQKGWTQTELAKRCEVSAMYISQIEKGVRIPKWRICRLLSEILDLDTKRLLFLAYKTSAPKELQGMLAERSSSLPYEDEREVTTLFKAVMDLSEDRKKQVVKVLRDVLNLVGVGDEKD
jgi:transcriptional regulator with XRE-family HTH domain